MGFGRDVQVDLATAAVLAQLAEREPRYAFRLPEVDVKAAAPESKARLCHPCAWYGEHRLDPLASILVTKAIEEDIEILREREGSVDVRIGGVVERMRPTSTHRHELLSTGQRVREEAVVLGEVRP